MLLKENSTDVREKAANVPPQGERAGEGVRTVSMTSGGVAVAGVAPDGRALSAGIARPADVSARRRSRRNLLL
ncbi:MAG TPA: hypothetical protein VK421_16550 [Pyrinomonadaceae bacterium]|nr:hypothetical protein [Pyrinomonadaceae bacterium]